MMRYRSLRQKYTDAAVDPSYPFRPDTRQLLDDNVASMERAYTAIVTAGDEDAARRDLRSHLREHVIW